VKTVNWEGTKLTKLQWVQPFMSDEILGGVPTLHRADLAGPLHRLPEGLSNFAFRQPKLASALSGSCPIPRFTRKHGRKAAGADRVLP
jgi:hypothetical protein